MELNTQEFLDRLHRSDIDVRTKDGKLLLTAPVGVLTKDLQAELRRRKVEILTFLAKPVETLGEMSAPLTFAQQRLWLVDRLASGAIEYNISQAWALEGAIDHQAMRRAIDILVNRHPALRTRIELRPGGPVQVVTSHVDVPYKFTDLVENMQDLDALLVEEGRHPFVLDRAPLIRFHLVRLDANRHLLCYTVHHIVSDQWSLGILRHDLTAIYAAALSGQSAELPPLSINYHEIAEWEQSRSRTELFERQSEYWRHRLLGIPALFELPFSKSRQAHQNSAGATLSLQLETTLSEQLRQLAIRSNTSLYLLMLSIFGLLLYRYSGQNDICLGTPVSGRKRREEESVVGLFLNMLPLRLKIDPAENFNQLVRRTSEAVLADFEQSDIPFQRLVMDLQPERSQAFSPLFQVVFSLNPKGGVANGEAHEIFTETSKFDLTLLIVERQHNLEALFEYRTDLFDSADMEQFGDHFVCLAESVANAPEVAIGKAQLLTTQDLDAFGNWNATSIGYDRSDTLVSLFEMQAALHPDAPALLHKGITLCYRELQERVTLLATSLRASGAGPDVFVATCLDRTPDLIIAILAVLYTGAAYLPLDPKYPEQRLRFMLRDSGARLMITQPGDLSTKFAGDPELKIVFPDWESPTVNVVPAPTDSSLSNLTKPRDPAYLIYTSGSTGTPKGVVVEHGNAVALIAWARFQFDKEWIRGVLASTSVCFDLSIFEIFLPLSTGNTVVLINDILELLTCPEAEKVTLINTVPSAMNALLQTRLPSSINTVCMAGEYLPTELADRVYAAGIPRVFDLYGPTETTTYSTCALRSPGATANIGVPIGNTRIYLLDEFLKQVPPGALGEIFIAGDGVSRGYWGRPDLTEERFLEIPGLEPEGRLYRTGDIARRRVDGSLVYLGRRDQQVKLRGHRIELGEVENALREVSGVSEVAVVIQKRKGGDCLTAFVRQNESPHFDSREWLAALRERLPAYMIPALIVPVACLPILPNGKVDRKGLSLLMEEDPTIAFEPPREILEQWLANIWAARLGIKQVARNAHFFDDLGGHSLAAFEIFSEMEMRLGVVLGLATLFQAPTVELLARVVRRHRWNEPRHLTFVSSGSEERVIYIIDHQPEMRPQSLRGNNERVMAIKLESLWNNFDGCFEEITSLETNRPSLMFAAAVSRSESARRLAEKMALAGFPDVSVSTL